MRSPTRPSAGLLHCPCRIAPPGPADDQRSAPSFLFTPMKLGAPWSRQTRVGFVDAIRCAHEEHVASGDHGTVGRFVRKHTEHGRHVEFPDSIGRRSPRVPLIDERPVVLLVAKPRGVEASKLTLGGDVVKAIAFEEGGTRRHRQEKIGLARQIGRLVLPEEATVFSIEGEQCSALVDHAWSIPLLVSRADEHAAAADDRAGKVRRSELG